MFVDASVIVAILLAEADHDRFLESLDGAEKKATSVVALFEAMLGVSRTVGVRAALKAVENLVETVGMQLLEVDHTLLPSLAEAHGRYGKGTGHPARLNMGDCYSYALAKQSGAKLLYKGDDFAQTDLA